MLDIIFIYTNKDGQVKTRPFIDIPFENLKHTRLKELNLRVFRNGGIYFVVRYWFQRKTKTLTLGEYIPGIFGKKEFERIFNFVTKTSNKTWRKIRKKHVPDLMANDPGNKKFLKIVNQCIK